MITKLLDILTKTKESVRNDDLEDEHSRKSFFK